MTPILWRERSYELFEGGRWELGQFDRVVVTGSGESRRAVVYDFKTNAVHRGESVAAFEGRMCVAYAGQMSAYRRALASLLSMPPERISSVLLLQATGSAVSVA